MRLAFLGTPTPAVVCLGALVGAGHEVCVVITRPDRRRGRGAALVPSPVAAAAADLGLDVRHELGALDEFEVELGVVVAYGAIIPPRVLERVPMLNVHFSLLPRWRGAAPVARAILAGDEETGVGIMSLEEGLDTGPVHAEARVSIRDQTLSELTDELARLGADLLVEVLSDPARRASPRAQRGEVTYAAKLGAADYVISPEQSTLAAWRVARLERSRVRIGGRTVRVVRARVRDASGPPGTVRRASDGLLLNCADGALSLERLQPDSGRAMDALSWWAGARLSEPTRWEGLMSGAKQ